MDFIKLRTGFWKIAERKENKRPDGMITLSNFWVTTNYHDRQEGGGWERPMPETRAV